ncbi:hypothetical protein ABZ942_24410 [Nocardia sp. NPDC046473]|uniref:hypothetical protein n=1 Tax=Nocardia sp. NPDC046473 TaxID=3155733 RepID=UPI0033CD36AC
MTSAETLPTTTLGASGIEVSVQGLGCMGISEFYGAGNRSADLSFVSAGRE